MLLLLVVEVNIGILVVVEPISRPGMIGFFLAKLVVRMVLVEKMVMMVLLKLSAR